MEKVKKIIIQLDLRNKIVWLSYIAVSFIMWIVRPFFLNIPVVNAFNNRDDSASYIYKGLDYAWMNSNLIGSSFTKEQIISYLPDYNSKCAFTYIAVRYGSLVSIILSILIVILIIVGIVLLRKKKSIARNIIVCIFLQVLMLVSALILQNWQIMPFVF